VDPPAVVPVAAPNTIGADKSNENNNEQEPLLPDDPTPDEMGSSPTRSCGCLLCLLLALTAFLVAYTSMPYFVACSLGIDSWAFLILFLPLHGGVFLLLCAAAPGSQEAKVQYAVTAMLLPLIISSFTGIALGVHAYNVHHDTSRVLDGGIKYDACASHHPKSVAEGTVWWANDTFVPRPWASGTTTITAASIVGIFTSNASHGVPYLKRDNKTLAYIQQHHHEPTEPSATQQSAFECKFGACCISVQPVLSSGHSIDCAASVESQRRGYESHIAVSYWAYRASPYWTTECPVPPMQKGAVLVQQNDNDRKIYCADEYADPIATLEVPIAQMEERRWSARDPPPYHETKATALQKAKEDFLKKNPGYHDTADSQYVFMCDAPFQSAQVAKDNAEWSYCYHMVAVWALLLPLLIYYIMALDSTKDSTEAVSDTA